jgi:hypothetical protein
LRSEFYEKGDWGMANLVKAFYTLLFRKVNIIENIE